MGRWYNNRQLFHMERDSLTGACPLLGMVIAGAGFQVNSEYCLGRESAIVHGSYGIQVPNSPRSIEYGIFLVIPDEYPKSLPMLFCNDPKLPIGNIDRHIMSTGQACLGVYAEIGTHWLPGSSIVDFLHNLVAPFLVWQAYYERHGTAPSWGERSHAEKGILEFYREFLETTVDGVAVSFMRLLARKNHPQGHEPCPCGSGKKLRDCHLNLLHVARERLAWQDVQKDLAALDSSKKLARKG